MLGISQRVHSMLATVCIRLKCCSLHTMQVLLCWVKYVHEGILGLQETISDKEALPWQQRACSPSAQIVSGCP